MRGWFKRRRDPPERPEPATLLGPGGFRSVWTLEVPPLDAPAVAPPPGTGPGARDPVAWSRGADASRPVAGRVPDDPLALDSPVDRQAPEGAPEPAPSPAPDRASPAPAPAPDRASPAAALPRLGFVGAGRVGLALGIAFHRAGWPVTAVASRDEGRRRRFTEAVTGTHAFATADELLDEVDLAFLTVPDDAIAQVAGSLRLYSGQAIVHTSGLLPSSVLTPALAAGTEAGSFHPLVAFAEIEGAIAALSGATIAIEGDPGLLSLLADLARALGAEPVRVEAGGKAAYHAAAVLAAGGVVALLDVIAALGRGAGLDEAGSLAIYGPLVRQALAAADRLGISAALTGPIVRGDAGTLAAHLDAVQRLAPDALDLYRAAARREIALASARGDLAPDRADLLSGLLAKVP